MYCLRFDVNKAGATSNKQLKWKPIGPLWVKLVLFSTMNYFSTRLRFRPQWSKIKEDSRQRINSQVSQSNCVFPPPQRPLTCLPFLTDTNEQQALSMSSPTHQWPTAHTNGFQNSGTHYWHPIRLLETYSRDNYWLRAGRTRGRSLSPDRGTICLLYTSSRLAVGYTQWVPGTKAAGAWSWPDTPPSSAVVKNGGFIHPLPHTSSWRGA
jgi:hypothetical protein